MTTTDYQRLRTQLDRMLDELRPVDAVALLQDAMMRASRRAIVNRDGAQASGIITMIDGLQIARAALQPRRG